MRKNVSICVSTDPISSIEDLIDYAKSLSRSADFIHCDIMDGKFVPRKTHDQNMVESLNANCLSMLDVHLMVNEPSHKVDDYINAGANILTVHYEAFADKEELARTLKHIKKRDVLCGLSFNPSTPFKDVKMFCYDIDVLLVMSVEPGLSGQKLMSETFSRIKTIENFRATNDLNFKIEVDGGVNDENAQALINAGADMLVSGSFIFKAHDREKAIKTLRGN